MQEAADLRPRVHLARALLEATDQGHRLEPLARGLGLWQPGHQCSTVAQRARNSSASSCDRSARSARASLEAAWGGRSQNRTTSPASTSTTSMWSTLLVSASSAGVRPPRVTISRYARLAFIALAPGLYAWLRPQRRARRRTPYLRSVPPARPSRPPARPVPWSRRAAPSPS